MTDRRVHDIRPTFESRVDLGSGVAALFGLEPKDGQSWTIGIEHECVRRDGLIVLHAPRLVAGPAGHAVHSDAPLTVTPSVLCEDCGLHGFITDGVWRSV